MFKLLSILAIFYLLSLSSAEPRRRPKRQGQKVRDCQYILIYIDICNMVNLISDQSLAAHNGALRVPLPGQQKLHARSGGGLRRIGGLSRCGTGAIWQIIG